MTLKSNFRIVFMGTPDFAVESLKALVDNSFNIVGVVTAPDRPAGRGQKISQSAVKKYSVENGLQLLQPTNLKSTEFIEELKSLNADISIIVAFRMLPEAVWSMPPMGSINLHASLLPQYRGAAPINWVVINGEKKTGVSTFFLKHEIDTGDILFQEELLISPEDTAGIIHDKLMVLGAQLLIKTTQKIIDDSYSETPQKHTSIDNLKHAPKIFKNNCKIDWTKPGKEIIQLIRGLSPYPTAWCEFVNKKEKITSFKIFNATYVSSHEYKNTGEVLLTKDSFKITCIDGAIHLTDIQMSGKKRMNISDFLKGINKETTYKIIA